MRLWSCYTNVLFILLFFITTFVNAIDFGSKTVFAVNCGGPSYNGAYGIKYQQDFLKIGTASNYGTKYSFPNAEEKDVALYQTERWHNHDFEYSAKVVKDGNYVIVLKFSEVWFQNPGEKIFDVSINDQVVIQNLDVHYRTGAAGLAYDVYIGVQILENDIFINDHHQPYNGQLKIKFLKGKADNPKINAIAIIKGLIDEMPPVPKPLNEFPPVDDEENEEEEENYYATKQLIKEEREKNEQLRNAESNNERTSSSEVFDESEQYEVPPSKKTNPFETGTNVNIIAIVTAILVLIPLMYCWSFRY